jgi:hypothetical protein
VSTSSKEESGPVEWDCATWFRRTLNKADVDGARMHDYSMSQNAE